MCCIFTCVGWVIDLVQRLWTFIMSCCISTAICCTVVTASVSGIALGYNYSLAEYIDLKETNVSVYLKRGVFDDEIVDDMEWRRAGHLPVKGHIGEDNLITAPPADPDDATVRSGRRMDDSVFESDDHHRFEGSLMKLTAKPVFSTTTSTTMEPPINELVKKYPQGSLDQLKEVQSMVNRRKMNAMSLTTDKRGRTGSTMPTLDERYVPYFGNLPLHGDPNSRRMNEEFGPGNSARLAVPDAGIFEPSKWFNPKVPPEKRSTVVGEEARTFTYPLPVTFRTGPLRPTRPVPPQPPPTHSVSMSPPPYYQPEPKSLQDEIDDFKTKLLLEKYEKNMSPEEFYSRMKQGLKKAGVEDYDDVDIKGLPVRKKRHITELFGIYVNCDNNTISNYTSTKNDTFISNHSIKNNDTSVINFTTVNNHTEIYSKPEVTYTTTVNRIRSEMDYNMKNILHKRKTKKFNLFHYLTEFISSNALLQKSM